MTFCLWLTGLPCSGKTTIARAVEAELAARGVKIARLDGDTVREGLCRDLGFSREDRDENLRRVGFLAELLVKNNVPVIASFVSPYRAERANLRKNIPNFCEIFIATPGEICEKRDVKGMWARARAGEIRDFTGVDDPYEIPENPDLTIPADREPVEKSVERIFDFLAERGFLPR